MGEEVYVGGGGGVVLFIALYVDTAVWSFVLSVKGEQVLSRIYSDFAIVPDAVSDN